VALTSLLSLATSSAVFLARDVIIAAYTGSDARSGGEIGSGNALEIAQAALPLLAWVVAFHVLDAVQTMAAFVVRAYKVATMPMVIYALAMWGVGLGGGNLLGFNLPGFVPPDLQGATGFWCASTCGLALAAVLLLAVQARVTRPLQKDDALLAQASAKPQ
jgi:MATE family multidrug resistance protein